MSLVDDFTSNLMHFNMIVRHNDTFFFFLFFLDSSFLRSLHDWLIWIVHYSLSVSQFHLSNGWVNHDKMPFCRQLSSFISASNR